MASVLSIFPQVALNSYKKKRIQSSWTPSAVLPGWINTEVPHLVVQEDPQDGCHHAQDVGAGDGVAQHDQGHGDHHDPLGGVGHRVTQGADQVKDTKGNDVLGKITESTDYKQHQGPGPMRHRALLAK